jgi:flagellar basal-body rod protein FlgB
MNPPDSSCGNKFCLIRTTRLVDTIGMALTTERIELMTRLLDVAALRQDVIAHNVANVNTPGYSTLEVSFEEALHQAMKSGNLGQAKPEIVPGTGGMEREDGNNVDVDLEMARLQKNAHFFKIYSQMLANELSQFRSAITGH